MSSRNKPSKPEISKPASDKKPKSDKVDFEIRDEELDKVSGGAAGAAGTWSCRTK